MSFQGLTPEALVERSDSKNPATTCKGLTSSGRPCRRGLAATPGSSPANSPFRKSDGNGTGVVAILNEGDAAAFFCWQHKDQADNLVAQMKQNQRVDDQTTRIVPLQKRSSIDTLAEKVGVLDLEAESEVGHKFRKRRVKKRDTLPTEWQRIEGPLMSIPADVVEETIQPQRQTKKKQESYGRSNVKASWSCCIRADNDEDEDLPVRRRKRRSSQTRPRPQSYSTRPAQPQMQEHYDPRRQSQSRRHSQAQLTPTRPRPQPVAHASSPPHTQTQNFLSFIPQHLDLPTTSTLLAELAKPFAKDDEAGYIYIFWLTPTTENSTPDDDVASTILDGDIDYQHTSRNRSTITPSTDPRRKRATQLDRYASVRKNNNSANPPKILLKIGRAQNVHRRMTQWTKQCNQNITLVRYYPHYASEAADPRSPDGARVPHVNRVERLVHLELRGLGMGVSKVCEDCGREHKEWFEVEATRAGLKGVDECVRRWVRWAEAEGR
ncbi:hypothetical protein LTR64_005206 [Lithohypha guttulata]|uniref:uncharacterized protein n=1 Tax=Lithohypha guttulata TaxID=1690604 RepID=UPI002DDFB6C3|nr:hypothetical protein LTR51_003000 [Lithohypha guttulata]